MSTGPIFWHQGLYLQPHHFQWADKRLEELFGELASTMRPRFLGVRHIALDEGALAGNTLALSALEAIFPGTGILVRVPGNGVCAGRPLPLDTVEAGEILTVYAGLRLLKHGEANVTIGETMAELASASTRYGLLVGQEPLPDLYENTPDTQVRQLQYVVRLVLEPEKEDTADLVLMPVARLIRETENYLWDETYAPPCLLLSDSPVLSAIFKEVLDRLLGKMRQMDSYKGLSQRLSMGEMTGLFLVLRSLSRFAARFQIALEEKLLTPSEAYIMLRELVAELAVFSREYNSLGENGAGESCLVSYSHEDAAPAFHAAKDIVVSILDSLSTGPRHTLRFIQDPPVWKVALAPHVLEDKYGQREFWLVLHAPGSDLTIQKEEILGSIKLAAPAQLLTLLTHAVPGLPLGVEQEPPMGLSRQEGALYLRIHHDSPLWEEVKKQGGLSLDWNDAPADLEAYFVVLGG